MTMTAQQSTLKARTLRGQAILQAAESLIQAYYATARSRGMDAPELVFKGATRSSESMYWQFHIPDMERWHSLWIRDEVINILRQAGYTAHTTHPDNGLTVIWVPQLPM